MQCADNDSLATKKKNPSSIRPIASASIPASVRTRTSNKRPTSDSRAGSLSPLTPDPSPIMSPEDPKYPSVNNNINNNRTNSSTSRRPSASNSGQTQPHGLPAFGDLSKPDTSSAASSPRHLPSLYPNSTPTMSPSGHPLLSPASRPHYGITDPSQYSSSSGFYQLPPPLQPFGAPRQSPHHSPAIHPLSGHQGQHPLPPLPNLPSASLSSNNGYSPRSNPQMSPHMNHYLVSPALGPLSPYPTPQHQPQQHHLSSPHHHASPHHQYSHDHQRHSIPTMILPASALSSSSLSSPSGSAPQQHVHHLQESPNSSGRPYPIILPHGTSSSSSSSSVSSSSKKTTPPRAGGPSINSTNNGAGHAHSQSGGAVSSSGPPTPRRYLMMPPQTVPGGGSNSRGSRGSTSSRKSSGSATNSPLTGPSAPPPLLSPPSGPSSAMATTGSGSSSKRRASSHTKVVDQETRDLMRKVSHSAIERRRRERINDKILQLKHLVPSCVDEDHLHKLSILQSTIEYIQYLKSVLPASVANAKLSKATNNNPNNKTTDMLEALGGSIAAKVPLTPLMTTGLNHIYAKRMSLQQQEQQQHQPYRRRRGQDEDEDEDEDEEDEEYERRQRYQEDEDEDYEDSSSRHRGGPYRGDDEEDPEEEEDDEDDGMDRRQRKKPRSTSDVDRSSSTIIKLMSGILDPQQQQHLRQSLIQPMAVDHQEGGARHPSSASLQSVHSSSSPSSSSDEDAKDGLLLLASQSSAHTATGTDKVDETESNSTSKASRKESRRRQLREDAGQVVGSPLED